MQFLIDIALLLVYVCGFLIIAAWAWRFWMAYIHGKFLKKIDEESTVLLEIKIPREIMKSPLAMETFILNLNQGSGIGSIYERNFKGNLPSRSSLEIASLEGIIHFYIRTEKKFRLLMEASLYAQYPGIEISEADDYTKLIRYHHLSKDTSIWGVEEFLTQKWKPVDEKTGQNYMKGGKDYEMKADFLPIKTYVDYGLDKDPKEEFKTDPLAQLIELMGSIGEGQYFWYQIVVQTESVFDNKKKFPGFFFNEISGEHYTLVDMANKYKKQIRTAGFNVKNKPMTDEYGDIKQKKIGTDKEGKPIFGDALYKETKALPKKEMDLTKEEKDTLDAINRKISKPLFCVIIRFIYIAKKDKFNYQNIFSLLNAFRGFNGMNSFAPSPTDPYDFPWQNVGGKRVAWRSEEAFDRYVEREGFFPHMRNKHSNDTYSLEAWEDRFFWSSSMKTRKIFHQIYDIIFHPFSHATPDNVSVLNTEELATMWHFPGAVVGTPTLPRIDSMKGVPPVNLPQ